jgi:ankyrin repeat protein
VGLRLFLATGAFALAACTDSAPPASPAARAPQATATEPPAEASRPAVNRALGLGEVRNPEPFTLDHRLLDAASRNDRSTIERALAMGAQLQAKDDLGRSTLFLAVMDAKSLDLVRWLHEKGVPVDGADVGGRTPLSFAADDGLLDIVRYLVEQGAQVDAADVQKRTPLMHAAGADHPDVIAYLADHGADVNSRDQFGDTPLIAACAKGNVASATILIRRGADATLKDQEGRTAKERSAPEAEPCLRLPG